MKERSEKKTATMTESTNRADSLQKFKQKVLARLYELSDTEEEDTEGGLDIRISGDKDEQQSNNSSLYRPSDPNRTSTQQQNVTSEMQGNEICHASRTSTSTKQASYNFQNDMLPSKLEDGQATVGLILIEGDGLSDSDSDDAAVSHTGRKRRKIVSDDSESVLTTKTSSLPPTLINDKGLTKNQKRKLKKKRAKERKTQDERKEVAQEFSFKGTTSTSTKVDTIEDKQQESTKMLFQSTSVLQFLDGLQDLYAEKTSSAQRAARLKEEKECENKLRQPFLTKLEEELKQNTQDSNNEVSLLHSTMSSLMLQNKLNAAKKIEVYQSTSNLPQDLKEHVMKLFQNWMDNFINS